ncbi:hypothetical protein Syn7803US79_154 [Synechococcus phage ACG-2014a]|uniref:DNA endonuclease V n=1 Tax=Synechococcus phage ACG-2014a TaxID=1493507 RepID=A0A0E3FW56_9CAUD|nr:hypothetical protein Syn7803US79_154 [Synechococcus phage ACG-2014a]
MIKVFQNFLPDEDFKSIQNLVNGPDFPWFWNDSVTALGSTDDIGQFTHTLYTPNNGVQSNLYGQFKSILEKLLLTDDSGDNFMGLLYRAKLNLNPRQSTNVMIGDYHIDFTVPCQTALYYFNTNNGYTAFEDVNDVIYNEENTMVIFPSHIKHVGHSCTDAAFRTVLNLNYITY